MMIKSAIAQKQLDFLDWEIGTFFHFGIRTFYEGHVDWDMKPMPLDGFNPTELDCEQWIKVSKDAGANYAILVCKHHDGFANWPSKYTDYGIQNTPYKNGHGDVVREFVDACRKYNLKVGLYYSPADFSMNVDSSTHKDYNNYFIMQISELLSNYGTIDYLWFDGCGSEGQEYDKPLIINTIRTLQPEILIFNMWDPDTRWVGNEGGFANSPNVNHVTDVDFSIRTQTKESVGTLKYLPAECDFCMREHDWFYSDHNEHAIKSVDELMGIYYYSVGRGANFLINIGPDRRGRLPDKDADRLIAFGNEVKKRFSNEISAIEEFDTQEHTYTLKLNQASLINHVIIQENILNGEHIKSFSIHVKPKHCDMIICVYRGCTIGHKAICQFPSIIADQVIIQVDDNLEQNALKNIGLYCVL